MVLPSTKFICIIEGKETIIFLYTFLSNYILLISCKIARKLENRLSVIIYVQVDELLFLSIPLSKADTDLALRLAAQHSSSTI